MRLRPLELAAIGAAAAFCARSLHIATHSNYRLEPSALRDDLPFLSIVVPARNEERQIERCVRSLLAQAYPKFEVVAVDDQSTDATHEILERIASEDARLRVVRGATLPAGWVGKPWALVQGANVARGELLLFTDADTVHEPPAAAASASYLKSFALDAVSVLCDQELETLAERAVLPTIFWTIGFAVGSFDALNDPQRPDNALFNGQYVMIPARVYRAFGGHEVVHDRIAEDYELAHFMKRRGYRTHLVGASGLVRTRMYRSFVEIWHGFGKNLALGARENTAALVAGAAFFALISPLPEVLLVRALAKRRYGAALVQAVAAGATIAAAETGMRRSRLPKGSGLWLPAGVCAMLAILGKSIAAHGRGSVQWRGRRYP